MTDTTSLGFVYPEDDDYGDTGADVPRAVQELAESVNDFFGSAAAIINLLSNQESVGNLSGLGYQGSWADGTTSAGYRLDVTGRIHLEGTITAGAVDTTVVTFPSGLGVSSGTPRWVVPYRDSDFAIVQLSGFDLSVVFSPASPIAEDISLEGISWRATA